MGNVRRGNLEFDGFGCQRNDLARRIIIINESALRSSRSNQIVTMLNTYEAILHDNRIQWSGSAPPDLKPDCAVRVQVTLLDPHPSGVVTGQGHGMAEALQRLAASNESHELPDGTTWEGL